MYQLYLREFFFFLGKSKHLHLRPIYLGVAIYQIHSFTLKSTEFCSLTFILCVKVFFVALTFQYLPLYRIFHLRMYTWGTSNSYGTLSCPIMHPFTLKTTGICSLIFVLCAKVLFASLTFQYLPL